MKRRDRRDVRVTRVQPKTRRQGKKALKRLNTTKLKDVPTKQLLDERLDTIILDEQDGEVAWITLRDTDYSTAMECLGPSTKRHRDRFDENHAEIIDLIGKKRAAHPVHLHDPLCTTKKVVLRSICCTVQLKLRKLQDPWLSAKADEIQGYADKNDMKNFYCWLKEVYGPTSAGSYPLLSTDETKLKSEKNKILERWAEHFDGLLNRTSSINDKAIERLPQIPVNVSLDVSNPGGSSESYPSTIWQQSTRIWLNSCRNL